VRTIIFNTLLCTMARTLVLRQWRKEEKWPSGPILIKGKIIEKYDVEIRSRRIDVFLAGRRWCRPKCFR
jgi:hypothetical protein